MKTGVAGVSGLAALGLLLPMEAGVTISLPPDPGMFHVGGRGGWVLLLPMEAGVPIPLPADLVMFTVGERVAAGQFPLWLAVAGFEVIAAAGTAALFVACRGSGRRVVARFGPRIGLTQARVG